MLIAMPITEQKVAQTFSSASQKKSIRNVPRRGGTTSPWNDVSWCKSDLSRAIRATAEHVPLLRVIAAVADFVPVKGCEQLTILGAGYPSREEPQQTAPDVTGTRCGNMAFSDGMASLRRSPITQGQFRLLSNRVDSSICQCRRAP